MNAYLVAGLSVFGTLIAAGGGLLVAMLTRASQRETRTITDLRADLIAAEVARADAIVEARLLGDYAQLLRRVYTDETGKPAPPWPEGLTSR